MAAVPDLGRETGKVWVVLTAFAVIAIAIWVFYFRPQPNKKSIGDIVSQIEHGDELERMVTIRGLYTQLTKPAEFAQVFPYLIQATTDESAMVRAEAASVVGNFVLGWGTNAPSNDEREPKIVALCPKAEEALALLLNESSPTDGCDLRLMSSVTDVTGIPTTGESLIIVAVVDHVLRFRIFNADGKVVVDIDEERLRERTHQIKDLRKRLESLWPPHELTKSEKDEVITAVTSIVDRSPALRATAAKSLGSVAFIGKLDAPPLRLVACLDDESEHVRAAAVEALIEYRKGPELIVPLALRRIPTESRVVREAFTDVFRHVRLEPSVLPLLIEGLASENDDVCLSCTAAINHMGRDARPALSTVLTFLRKELANTHTPGAHTRERIIALATGAIGELSPDTDPLPGTIEILCEVLKRPGVTARVTDGKRPDSPVASAEASEDQSERLAEAAWSLGILGRYAASAVPLLLSTLAASPETADNLRGIIAESLAEISRGTPDEDRVIASLAKAWKTAPKERKAVIARALRSLGPKSEQLVPELRQLPPDETRSRIRRVRYPRSRHEYPVRE